MSQDELFRRAREMVAQSPVPLTLSEALAELGRRGRSSRRTFGVIHPMRADRTAFQHVEPPARRFWWEDRD